MRIRHSRPVIGAFCLVIGSLFRPGFGMGQVQPDLVIMPHDTVRQFGTALATGDIDGDGLDEIIIGSPVYDDVHNPLLGNVHIIFGDETLTDTIRLYQPAGRWTHLISGPEIDAGYSVLCADINNDAMDDIIIGAPQSTVDQMYERGLVYIILGKRSGWEYTVNLVETPPASTIRGKNEGDQFGTSLTAGDFNGDGFCDFAAGAIGLQRDDHTGLLTGAVFWILQDSVGFASGIDLSASPDSIVEIWGEGANDRFGWALDSGDINGDGYDDCLIGAYKYNASLRDEGACYLIPGMKSCPALIIPEEYSHDRIFVGNEFPEHMGFTLMVEDINGDMYPDLVFGSRQAMNGSLSMTGRMRIIWGSNLPFSSMDFLYEDPDVEITGALEYGQMSYSMACADVNGDGKHELLAGAPLPLNSGAEQAGEVYLWKGRREWPAVIDLNQESPDMVLTGMENGDWFGFSLTAGDVNGDGLADIVVGAPRADSSGAVYVYYGTPETSVSALKSIRPESPVLSVNFPNPFNSETVIQFTLGISDQPGDLLLFDVRGRLIRSWDLEPFVTSGGSGQVRWDSRNEKGEKVPSGLYLFVLRQGSSEDIRKITLLR